MANPVWKKLRPFSPLTARGDTRDSLLRIKNKKNKRILSIHPVGSNPAKCLSNNNQKKKPFWREPISRNYAVRTSLTRTMFSILFSSIYLISSSPILTPHSQPTKTIVNCHSVSLVKASEIDLYHDIATCQSNKLFFSSFLYRIMYVVFPFFSFFFFFKHFSGSPSYHNNKREKNFVYYRSGVVWEVKGGRNVWFEWRRAAPSFLLLPRVFFFVSFWVEGRRRRLWLSLFVYVTSNQ